MDESTHKLAEAARKIALAQRATRAKIAEVAREIAEIDSALSDAEDLERPTKRLRARRERLQRHLDSLNGKTT